jgi:NADPH-dependent 2,4-dienoyl-CoA reductase/sulfur reductase-like enzyme/peroxiredoxin family protein/rhodanese-related sulfurtransferase/TusA-related sulfurtransferase
MKILIVGGVAGGASAAARLRRNDERAEIILFERGQYISFANCGLPYYIGGVITDKAKLTLQTPESFHKRFNVDVRTNSEVVGIDRRRKQVTVKRTGDGSVYGEDYDKLILSPGAEPVRPRLPGFDGKRVFALRNIPDTYAIKEFCNENAPKSAVIIGGGYIGIEMAENLHKLGIQVTIVELTDHIIPLIDGDTAAELHNHLRSKGIRLLLGAGVNAIEETENGLIFRLAQGSSLSGDFAVLAAGVAPESKLVKDAGLATGLRNTILVDAYMKTSDDDIYAVGDAIQVNDYVSGNPTFMPLASPANKQGRLAADNICGANEKYDGSQGSSILRVFDLTLAATGLSETALKARGIKYLKSYTYSPSNASYYPGCLPMSIKLLFSPDGGRILGAQAVGFSGVDKRVDLIATVIRLGGTIHDLTRLELCYAPPFSSAKDPVNMAGYTAENILKNRFTPFYPEDVAALDTKKSLLLDVRTKEEFAAGTIPGAVNIPLDSLREELDRLPKDREINVFCQIGLRGYLAARILLQHGFAKVKNLSGGYRLWQEIQKDRSGSTAGLEQSTVETETQLPAEKKTEEIVVDACGLNCPGPIMAVHKAMAGAPEGTVFKVKATDPAFAGDIEAFCRRTGAKLLRSDFDGKSFSVTVQKGKEVPPTNVNPGNDKSIIVFSGDLDKAIASFIIANGAVAMGRKVHMFFTFWGLNILRKTGGVQTKKDFISAMFGHMMPKGSKRLGLSRLNMGGMGAKLIRAVMRNKNISSLEELIQEAVKNGVEITACSMSMDVMGIQREELIDGVKVGGVASFLASAEESDTSLFI